jgi:predicted DNA-binding protein
MKRISTFLTEVEIERLKALSESTGISFAELIRRAVDEYLDRQPRRAK